MRYLESIPPNALLIALGVLVIVLALIAKVMGPNTSVAFTTKGKAQKKLRPVWDTQNTAVERLTGADGTQQNRHHRPVIVRAKWISRKSHLCLVCRAARGSSVEELTQTASAIRDAYRAYEITATPLGSGLVRFDIYRRPGYHRPFQYFALMQQGEELSERGKVLLGLRDDGNPVAINLGHTLIVGATGAGKASVMWTILISMVRKFGLGPDGVKLFAIDPKHAEFASTAKLFECVAYDPEESVKLLDTMITELKDRQSLGVRTFQLLNRAPILLFIDEINSLTAGADRTTSLRIREQVNLILKQGRSAGMYIVAAGQQPQKDALLGISRSQFQNRICLRVETADEVKLVLGDSAVDKGVRIHELPPATETNGYATAGVGYVNTDEEPAPVRFRSPWIADEEIENFCNNPNGGVFHD